VNKVNELIHVQPNTNREFCYWSVATGDHAKMFRTCIISARRVGVTEDFHVWTDEPWDTLGDPGVFFHHIEELSNDHYLFKFEYLKEEVSKLDYAYFVWLDADNFFVRKPRPFDKLLRDNKWFVQLESKCEGQFVKRDDWWGVPIKWYKVLLHYRGVPQDQPVYNTNAGFWIVRRESIDEFYNKAIEFYEFGRNELHLLDITEEVALAYIGHFVNDWKLNVYKNTNNYWASDWTGQYVNKLPMGEVWTFEDYMSGEKNKNSPAIVHLMRAKELLIKGFNIVKKS
jgi:hypothetical protein